MNFDNTNNATYNRSEKQFLYCIYGQDIPLSQELASPGGPAILQLCRHTQNLSQMNTNTHTDADKAAKKTSVGAATVRPTKRAQNIPPASGPRGPYGPSSSRQQVHLTITKKSCCREQPPDRVGHGPSPSRRVHLTLTKKSCCRDRRTVL